MKINGITVKQPKPLVVVLPLDSGELVIRARYVSLDELEELDKILPQPKPPMITKVENDVQLPSAPDVDDSGFKEKLSKYHDLRMAWIYLTSLSATEGLEWDTVKMEDPATWENWSTDLEATGLPNTYIMRVSRLVTDAQGWNPDRIEEATANFLATAPVE